MLKRKNFLARIFALFCLAPLFKDIKFMAQFEILKVVDNKSNPGHGLVKVVNLSFQNLTLQAIL